MPNLLHCWVIMLPARVITGRPSPSTISLMPNGLPSGMNHLSPFLV